MNGFHDAAAVESLAVVGPKFFSYLEAIAGEFERRGIAVTSYDEKRSNVLPIKALFRLGLGLGPAGLQQRYLDRVADKIIGSNVRDVLLVGVEVVTRRFVKRLSRAGLRVHLYMWDGQANKGRFRTYLDTLASAATFDPRDAGALGMTYIPLFAEEAFDRQAGKRYDVGFCGTVHTTRAAAINTLLRTNLKLGLKLFYHSRAMFLAKGGSRRLLRLIDNRPVAKDDVAELFASSRYVLDIPHPGQTGLTARTFEALLAGSRLITTSADAKRLLPRSLHDRVTIIGGIGEVPAVVSRRVGPLPALSACDRYFLSLRRFVDDLLAQMAAEAHRQVA